MRYSNLRRRAYVRIPVELIAVWILVAVGLSISGLVSDVVMGIGIGLDRVTLWLMIYLTVAWGPALVLTGTYELARRQSA